MDQSTRSKLRDLRNMGSTKAANWLIENCAITSDRSGDAIQMIPRLSWKRSDQLKLAEHYLSRMPYAHARPYEALASVMSITRFVNVIERFLPVSEARKGLLSYHLAPVLRRLARSDADRAAVEAVLSKI